MDQPVRSSVSRETGIGVRSFFQLERERLFARTWMFAGYAHELPESGDAVPAEVAGFGVILTRNQSGSIRAYHNVCPHRGMYLLDKPLKNAPVIKCPYHGWAFDMDGALKSTPHWGGFKSHHLDGFDPSCHGMKSLRCEQWHEWVFVNIDGEAPPFASTWPRSRAISANTISSLWCTPKTGATK